MSHDKLVQFEKVLALSSYSNKTNLKQHIALPPIPSILGFDIV